MRWFHAHRQGTTGFPPTGDMFMRPAD